MPLPSPLVSAAHEVRSSRPARVMARLGLASRCVFYLLLSLLVLHLALTSHTSREANAGGVLSEVSASLLGLVLLYLAAAGFAAFALVRLAGALTDHSHPPLRRLSTAGQALTYAALSFVTLTFALGDHSTGTEQSQQHSVSSLLAHPLGRIVLGVLGLVLVCVCAWQVYNAFTGDFSDTLHLSELPVEARRLALWTGRIGIPARALAFLPVGVLFVVAALTANPHSAKGLDSLLTSALSSPWTRTLVVLVGLGFLVFSLYSAVEARYRSVSSGA